MNTTRSLGLVSGLLLGASLLAACGGSATPAASVPASTAAPAKPAASPAASSAAAGNAAGAATAGSAAASPAGGSTAAGSAAAGATAGSGTVMVADSAQLGKILADGAGKTLYTFAKDTADTSNCSGGCLTTWPPFTGAAAPAAPAGVSGTFGLIPSSKQITFKSMPLYYFKADVQPGDTKGEGVGGNWHVVKVG